MDHILSILFFILYLFVLDLKSLQSNPVFVEMHTLLQVLYRRDCRRRYTPDNHWLIKEIRVGQFMADLDKGKKPVLVSFVGFGVLLVMTF